MDQNVLENDLHEFCSEQIDPDILESLRGKQLGFTRPRLVKGDVCKYFCKGAKCKYCGSPENFPGDQEIIKGLYSAWITDNILAMARPRNEVVEELKGAGIKTVINMEISGEHAQCGPGNLASGFSYDPDLLMNARIDYCNYPCDDFGVITVAHLLDVVKNIQHRLKHGKVAIHCHAGLGRTGVAIGCYLVFNNRMDPLDAIKYVRRQRPNSIQNTVQVNQIVEFAKYLTPLRRICYIQDPESNRFSLQECVRRQRNFIHGKEVYLLNDVPKILFVCLHRLSQLGLSKSKPRVCKSPSSSQASIVEDLPPNIIKTAHFKRWTRRFEEFFPEELSRKFCGKLQKYFSRPYTNKDKMDEIKTLLNSDDDSWNRLSTLQDVHLLCQLLADWLINLKFPVLRTPDLEMIKDVASSDIHCLLLKLESSVCRTLYMFLTFMARLSKHDQQQFTDMCGTLLSLLTQKTVLLPCFDNVLKHSNVKVFEVAMEEPYITSLHDLISRVPAVLSQPVM